MHKLALKLGAHVYGRNKHCGHLAKIVIEPTIWQLTDLIVENGLIFKQATVLPIAEVADTLGQTVNLKITHEQLRELPEYQETVVNKGIADWPAVKSVGEVEYLALPVTNVPNLTLTRQKERIGVSKESLILDNQTRVECLDGYVGHLSHLIVDARDNLISDLVFCQGTLFPKHYLISSYYVDHLTEPKIVLAKTLAESDQLPQYTFLQYR